MRSPYLRLLLLTLLLLAGSAARAAAQGEIVLQPGDLVKVTVYREPDLDGEFPVDENGVVSFPLIGTRRVAGIPIGILRDSLVAAYRQHLRNPSINIVPLRRVNVLGEVNRPGMYTIDPTTSLAGAVALAGGSTAFGDLNRIRIVRGNEVIRQRVGAGETLGSAGIRSNDQIYVDRRSWFDRNSGAFLGAVLSAAGILTSIIIATSRGG
ncbi:MAG TPA: polysaccharide biosynthesis/export family protein [Longimicrobiaceae bacterium]|nr:polysaccharide biosynthesis/export family protein [Longimicrobiaceae bacterium]